MVRPASSRQLAVSLTDAAARLGVHRDTLRAAISRGEVPAARIGRRWVVPLHALDGLLGVAAPNVNQEVAE